jgi:dihydroorotate dehydrogenase electron transfer subunit
MPEIPAAHKVKSIRREARGVFSIWLEGRIGETPCEPGQFIMVWLPGLGEKPYAVSYMDADSFAFTVKQRGPVSSKLAEIRPGEFLGVRGPYGRGYRLNERGILIGGSIGMATLALIADKYPQMPMMFGARSAEELIFTERYPKMRIFTDDGSAGEKGFPTAALPEMLKTAKYTTVYTCGPEAMMVRVFQICEEHKVECQASLERYMKCGFGVCGQCVCDSVLVCKDGPVLPSAALRTLTEFGKTALRKDGTRVDVREYAQERKLPEPESDGVT